jgi:hypothetical protein
MPIGKWTPIIWQTRLLDYASSSGGILVVPQFTLYGDVRHGKRPSFDAAAHPERALADSMNISLSASEPLAFLAKPAASRRHAGGLEDIHFPIAGKLQIAWAQKLAAFLRCR